MLQFLFSVAQERRVSILDVINMTETEAQYLFAYRKIIDEEQKKAIK